MKKVQTRLYTYIKWLEYLIAVLLSVAIVVVGTRMAVKLWDVTLYGDADEAFAQLLNSAFALIIGVEFIKMIIKPTSKNVLEVIMFTVARFLVVEHSSMLTCLLGVVALAVVFAIRKFLYFETAEESIPQPATDTRKTSVFAAPPVCAETILPSANES